MPSLMQFHPRPVTHGRINTFDSRPPLNTGTSYYLEEGESEEDIVSHPPSKPSPIPPGRKKKLRTATEKRRTTTMTLKARDATPRSSISPLSPPPRGPPPPLPSPPPLPPPSLPQKPQPASTASGNAKSPTEPRRASLSLGAPDQLLRTIRERSRDSYQRIKGCPVTKAFQYAVTPSAPSIQTFATNQGRSMHSITAGGAPTIPSGPRYNDASPARATCGAGYIRGLKRWVYNLIHNFQMSLSVGSVEELRRAPTERTLRIKNNKAGCCVYEVTSSDSGDLVTPIQSLKILFPQSKYLQKSLRDWNRHFQSPPAHWVINFIPRAYLRRGYYLAEDVCEYLMQHPDGCRYKIEYEPIGHDFVLVGTVTPRGPAVRERNPSRYWEGKEKRDG